MNAHKIANPFNIGAINKHSLQARPVPDQQPPTMRAVTKNVVTNLANNAEAQRNSTGDNEQRTSLLNDILALPPITSGHRATTQPRMVHDADDSEEEGELCRKRNRENSPLETWIEGFHTGADAAPEQTLSSYPENRPGANRLNFNSFRDPQILGKVIKRNMGLQQHVASFPYWKKSTNGRLTQSHMEAHNIARMLQL